MRDSWRQFFRRLAAATFVSVSMAWASAMTYAVQLAYDDATNPAYQNDDLNGTNDGNPANNTNGWLDGDNGGFGFTPWDFSSTLTYQGVYYGQYANTDFHKVDDGLQSGTHYSNPFNNIGKAWDIGTSTAYTAAGHNGGPPRAGRGFSSLQVGQTLKVTIDNPTPTRFFKGFLVQLIGNTGGVHGNICYGGYACTPGTNPKPEMSFTRFEYFTYGEWKVEDATSTSTNVFVTDTAAAGALFSVTRTGTDTYDVLMQSLNGGPSFSGHQTFKNPGVPVDWIQFTFFNTTTDAGTPPTTATDFYIRSMEITGAAPPGVPGDYNNNGVVDAGDYVLWRKGGPLANEVDTPGTVNAADYTAWRARFGNTSGSGSSLSGGTVPEPGAFVLLVAGGAGMIAMGSRRKSKNQQG